MTVNALIDLTLLEIAREYHSGTLPWMKKNRPNEWGDMITLEKKINGMVLEGNLKGLRGALDEYQSLILAMLREFKSLQEKKGQGMFNFVERPKPPGEG